MEMPSELLKLRASDPDLALVLDVFAQVDAVYREALKAAGVIPDHSFHVANTADVTISFSASGPGVASTNR